MNDGHPAHDAVRAFWKARSVAAAKQAATGRQDRGSRGAVTAGTHLKALEDIVVAEFIAAGLAPSTIRRKAGIGLPGYYRPAKKWDVVVVDGGLLVAAIEFKSHVGPSFGNNFNNRIEEAIGSAADVWRAYQAGTFGGLRPWLGYFMLLENAPASTRPVAVPATVLPAEAVFARSSYQERYRILCQRLLRERLYDAVCLLVAPRGPDSFVTEPDPELGFAAFASRLAGRAMEVRSRSSMGEN
jgi:hypothetical protein